MSEDFSMEQIASIAQTILQYEEQHAFPPGSGKPYAAAKALLMGQASPQLSWTLNVMLGCLPTKMARTDRGSGNRGERHPLEFAAIFDEHKDIQQLFLERARNEIRQELEPSVDDPQRLRWFSESLLPKPADPNARLAQGASKFFRVLHASWYQPEALVKLVEQSLVYQTDVVRLLADIGDSLQRTGDDTSILAFVARRCLGKQLTKPPTNGTDYTSLTRMVQLAGQEPGSWKEIAALLKKSVRMYRILALSLEEADAETMVMALRALAGTSQLQVLRYLGRSPTIEEIERSNIKGLGQILYRMPWPHLAPLVREHGGSLRAVLLRRNELIYEQLQKCLSDHQHRYSITTADHVVATFFDENGQSKVISAAEDERMGLELWAERKQEIKSSYFEAQNVRQEIERGKLSRDVALLILLQHLARRADLARYTEAVRAPKLQRALHRYKSPFASVIIDT